MSKEDIKKFSVEVSKECYKKLKILSIQKDLSLPTLVKDILERSVAKKNVLEEELS
jgi:hypothetical protein